MSKSEFKELLKEKNEAARQYSMYRLISLVIFCVMMGAMFFFQLSGRLPLSFCLIIEALIVLLVVVPFCVIDLKNDSEVNSIYKNYNSEKSLSSYTDKRKYFKVIMAVELVLIVISSILIPGQLLETDKNDEDEVMSITTNKGNVIDMEYQDVGKFSIKIPKDFEIMSEDILQIKYPSDNGPELVYTNEDATVNIAFNFSSGSLDGKDLYEYVDALKLMLEKLEYLYYSFDFEVDGLKLYTLSLVTPAVDTSIYNYMIIFSIDDQIMLVSFNCIEEYMDEWKDVAEFVAKSIKVE